MLDESVEGGVVVEWLRIWRLFVLIASENCAVMSASLFTPVRGVWFPEPYPYSPLSERGEPPKPSLRPKVAPEPSW